MHNIDKRLRAYLNNTILTQYQILDKAHQKDHVRKVLKESLIIAKDYQVDMTMVAVVAYFHDIGMIYGRHNHHLTGAKLLEDDLFIKTFFSNEDIKIMKEAVEDHRASKNAEPRSIYGKIIAEADRDINPNTIIKRTIQFGLSEFPHLSKTEVITRAIAHLHEKYGPNGYLKLWINTPKNTRGLLKIHQLLSREKELSKMIEKIYENEKKH